MGVTACASATEYDGSGGSAQAAAKACHVRWVVESDVMKGVELARIQPARRAAGSVHIWWVQQHQIELWTDARIGIQTLELLFDVTNTCAVVGVRAGQQNNSIRA